MHEHVDEAEANFAEAFEAFSVYDIGPGLVAQVLKEETYVVLVTGGIELGFFKYSKRFIF